MTTEAKVGAFTVAAFTILVAVLVQLGGVSWGAEKNYPIEVMFDEVTGLKPGNAVTYAGVNIGKVDGVYAERSGARVQLMIRAKERIPKNAVFGISSDGLMGEKFISIMPGDDSGDEFLKAGDFVQGQPQRGLEKLMVTADAVMLDIQKLINSLNNVFGDERVQKALIDSAVNIQELTDNLNRMSAVMARMAMNNESDVRLMVHNLMMMSESMTSAAGRVDRMLADVDNDGQTAIALRSAVENLSVTSQRVERMAASLEGVVTDPKTADDLKTTLANARNVSEKANKMMNKVGSMTTKSGAEILYGDNSDKHYKVNSDFQLNFSDREFLRLGVDDMGESNKKNLQFGTTNGSMSQRMGMIDDKAGLGVDAQLNDKLKMSVDAYDPNEFKLKLRAQYEMAPDTYLVGETDSLNRRTERQTFVGLRHSF